MAKWISNGDRVHDNSTGWAATCQSNFTANRIKVRHNADIDALTAEVDARDEVITKLLATARDAQRHDVGACDAYRRAVAIAEGRTE